jgi:hypothetical protein
MPTSRVIADLVARIERLEAAERARQERRGRRDGIDDALLVAIEGVFTGEEFDAAEVLRRRARSVLLATALDAANLSSPREVGRWLDRMCDGTAVCRGLRTERGYRWRVRRL